MYRFYGYINNYIIYSAWYSKDEPIKLVLYRKKWLEEIAENVNIEYKKD